MGKGILGRLDQQVWFFSLADDVSYMNKERQNGGIVVPTRAFDCGSHFQKSFLILSGELTGQVDLWIFREYDL